MFMNRSHEYFAEIRFVFRNEEGFCKQMFPRYFKRIADTYEASIPLKPKFLILSEQKIKNCTTLPYHNSFKSYRNGFGSSFKASS